MYKKVMVKNDKITLRGYVKLPDNAHECHLVVLMHGLTDNSNFALIRALYRDLCNKGIGVLAFDFDGHGTSDGEFIDMTIHKEVEDAKVVLEYVNAFIDELDNARDKDPDVCIISDITIVGHSQGGLVASMLMGMYPEYADKLVLLAPSINIEDCVKNGSLCGAEFDTRKLPEFIEIFDGYKLGRAYLKDAKTLNALETASYCRDLDVCIIRGSKDEFIASDAMEGLRKIYTDEDTGNTLVEHEIEGAPHDFAGFEDKLSEIIGEFVFE